MRHRALIPLSRDHHHALRMAHRLGRAAVAEDAARAEEARAFCAWFETDARDHFREEEELLLPRLGPGHPLVERAVVEHARLRALAAELAGELAAGRLDPDLLTRLGEGLDTHVRFEERELFEAVQRELDPGELEALAAAIEGTLSAAPAAPQGAADPAALLRAEHAELRPHLDHLQALSESLADEDEQVLRERLFQVRRFLRGAILVHAGLEEETVYPAAERLLRAHGGATRTMEIDHERIASEVDELDLRAEAPAYDDFVRGELRRILTSLEALLRVHFDKEERVYLPLLERLAPAEAAAVAEQMRKAATDNPHEH